MPQTECPDPTLYSLLCPTHTTPLQTPSTPAMALGPYATTARDSEFVVEIVATVVIVVPGAVSPDATQNGETWATTTTTFTPPRSTATIAPPVKTRISTITAIVEPTISANGTTPSASRLEVPTWFKIASWTLTVLGFVVLLCCLGAIVRVVMLI